MDNIPKEIVEKINQLNLTGKPYAAFDLDNTLLIQDIGEAVFAALLKEDLIQDFNWENYLDLLQQDREAAYKKVIRAMDGLELKKLKQITHDIINSEDTYIEIGEEKIPIPKPNLIMQSIVSLLKTKGLDVYVVTASNQVSSEIICWKHFEIPSSNVIGALVSTDGNEFISYSPSEIPHGEGKVNALKKRIAGKPLVTAGDGIWDKFLLDYTTTDGIRLWLGQNKNEFQKLKEEYYKDLNFYQIPRR